jgi:hypothetical protein
MKKEFVSYEIALALKELGFDEPCLMFYRGNDKELVYAEYYGRFKNSSYVDKTTVSAPLYQQAFRWFRDKYGLDKTIDNWTEQPMNGEIWDKAYQYYINGQAYHPYFKTYEEAELECLKKLIEIVKQ